jgi:hypothetical protein
MSSNHDNLATLIEDLAGFEAQIRQDMQDIRASLGRIKWALRAAGVIGVIAIVLLVVTVVRPVSRQLKVIASKVEQLESHDLVAALSDIAKLRDAIQAETRRIEAEAHPRITETLEESRKLTLALQADLSKVSPDGKPFPQIYATAHSLADTLEHARSNVGPEAQFPPLLQTATAIDARLSAALDAVDGADARGHRPGFPNLYTPARSIAEHLRTAQDQVAGPAIDGRRPDFPAVFAQATVLQGELLVAHERVTGAAPGQKAPPFPDLFAAASSLDGRLAIAHRRVTGVARGQPEPEFPDLSGRSLAGQRAGDSSSTPAPGGGAAAPRP